VQIRTQRMHLHSESGAAAHSIYKQEQQLTYKQQTTSSSRSAWAPSVGSSRPFQIRETS
jgi:(p)ppGpp synthase/HD superfamily hydrolase